MAASMKMAVFWVVAPCSLVILLKFSTFKYLPALVSFPKAYTVSDFDYAVSQKQNI
jgi:heme/copper-type cytochrome/quinol oxidase subunit 2